MKEKRVEGWVDRIAGRERAPLKETLFQPLLPRLPLRRGNRYVYRGCLLLQRVVSHCAPSRFLANVPAVVSIVRARSFMQLCVTQIRRNSWNLCPANSISQDQRVELTVPTLPA